VLEVHDEAGEPVARWEAAASITAVAIAGDGIACGDAQGVVTWLRMTESSERPGAGDLAGDAPGAREDGITVDTVLRWAERICGMTQGGPEAAAELLGFARPLSRDGDYSAVRTPPQGVTGARFAHDLRTRSELAFVVLELAPAGIALPSLAGAFGPGRELPRMHWDSPHQVVFGVERPDLPCTCDVIADFKGPLTAASHTTSIALHRRTRSGGG
jgi:hypothetical protein